MSLHECEIRIRLHPDAVKVWVGAFTDREYSEGIERRTVENEVDVFHFPDPDAGLWGHGGCGCLLPSALNGWREVSVELPVVNAGSRERDWRAAFNVSCSLEALFEAVNRVSVPPKDSDARQAMTVAMRTKKALHDGGAIRASISPACAFWVKRQFMGKGRIEFQRELEQALRSVLTHMWGDGCPDFPFKISSNGGRIELNNGDIAVLGAYSEAPLRTGEGYVLEPYHCESPIHQLPLLAGLARLSDLFYRRPPAALS